jgi:hypothetical protein
MGLSQFFMPEIFSGAVRLSCSKKASNTIELYQLYNYNYQLDFTSII